MHSDMMLLLARTTPADQVKRRSDGLSVFLIDMTAKNTGKGLEVRPIKAMINHNTTEVFFDNFRIPADSLIGEEGKGFRYILDGMNAERILVASEAVGRRPLVRQEGRRNMPRIGSYSALRSARIRRCSFRSLAPGRNWRRPT